jgi:pimeloyl-ACP methyl ester carboxylesterase
MDTIVFELPDGRELGFSEAGDRAGFPVFGFHGTPGSRRQILFETTDEIAKRAGTRLVVPDRPGYGHSTFDPGRRLTDWPKDVAALADRLGIPRFAVVGISGGGPHALVCAALLADRVTRAAVVSGMGPISTVADSQDMMASNRLVSSLARRSEKAVLPITTLMTTVARRWPEQAMKSMAKQLPRSDVAVLERPEVFAAFIADVRSSSATTARASAQDFSLFARPWGFELSDIKLPVDFWQGEADRNVPPDHARRQSDRVSGSVLHEIPGEGHFMVLDHLEEILRTTITDPR